MAEEEAFSSRTPPIAGPGLSEDPPRRLSSIVFGAPERGDTYYLR